MKITSLLFCEEAIVENINGQIRMNIINPFSTISPQFIPTNYSFSLVVNFIDMRDFSNDFQIIINDPDGNTIVDTNMIPLSLAGVNQKLPIEHQSIGISLNLRNVILPKEGIYSTIVKYGSKIETFEIGVFTISK